jgi:hypothetical protein
MTHIVARRAPFKVFNAIVFLVAVFMINPPALRWANKCFGNKPMNKALDTSAKLNTPVSSAEFPERKRFSTKLLNAPIYARN